MPEEELKWHWDEDDRIIIVMYGNGWKIQIDNQLPIELKDGNVHFISKGVWHRIIKGHGDLVVEITNPL